MLMRILRLIKRILKKFCLHLSQIYYYIVGNEVECNICHYKVNKLRSDFWHLYCHCPKCGSGVRQRLLMAAFTIINNFSIQRIIKDKKVLHFAPEKSLGKFIKEHASIYKTADFLAPEYSYGKIDYNVDISDMKEISNEAFDCVIACDVLEHVRNHISGIKEVYRILNFGGYCIFTVPQKDNLEKTFEDLSVIDPNEREKIFGQSDHLRIYGNDFRDMLENAGFAVTVVDEKFFNEKIVKKHVLFPPILSKHPLATNYRKVFFGKK